MQCREWLHNFKPAYLQRNEKDALDLTVWYSQVISTLEEE
jgi:hypothetical protein